MNRRGFSLIELMVVIAIIAILAAIALPLYRDFTCKTKAREPLKALADIKSSFAGELQVTDFTDFDWSNSDSINNSLNATLPTAGRWEYTGIATANIVSITVARQGSNPSCLENFSFTYVANREPDYLVFRVATTTEPKYLGTTNFTGGI